MRYAKAYQQGPAMKQAPGIAAAAPVVAERSIVSAAPLPELATAVLSVASALARVQRRLLSVTQSAQV